MPDSGVLAVIDQVARLFGVDPKLARAIAGKETGGTYDPTIIGDHGCSHGLFQLNTCGGEGAGMTLAQLQDPYTNASTALAVVAQVQQQHPDWTPGQIAAAAQRPADPVGYANDINAVLKIGGINAGGTVGDIGGTVGDIGGAIGGAVGGAVNVAINPVTSILGIPAGIFSNLGTGWVKDLTTVMLPLFLTLIFTVAGFGFLSMGVHRLTGHSPVQVFSKAKSTVDTAALAAAL